MDSGKILLGMKEGTFYIESLNTSRGGSERMFTGAEHIITKANATVNQRSGNDGEPR